MARASIPLGQLLAAALRELLGIPYDHAKQMTAEQIRSLVHFDHGIHHATDPIDEHWNLTPRLIAEHREKTKVDVAIIAKGKRVAAKQAAHQAVLVGAPIERKRFKRKIPSRPFPSGRTAWSRRK